MCIVLAATTNLLAMGDDMMLKFIGMNYDYWYEQIQFQLAVVELELVLVSEKPTAINVRCQQVLF